MQNHFSIQIGDIKTQEYIIYLNMVSNNLHDVLTHLVNEPEYAERLKKIHTADLRIIGERDDR